ncbi:hypothetical protein [Microbacterium rhizomatis]|uniref:Acetone carboxylase n=1 Tax=Microbacterium rhizomatis TaxID=1631477 RepID=A0A5J5J436_9MICO|nr:hypothetical protein [Microbacterium rhizomatis]KAA9110836.1 hypothetical protein F6B43_04145 [Microbacterium rhizomatis]
MSPRHDADSDPGASTAECSRAGCREHASWRITWRNPRIHTGDRRKIWVACDDHVEYLRAFLAAREFPVSVSALTSAGGVL